jgi:hypothetical protein
MIGPTGALPWPWDWIVAVGSVGAGAVVLWKGPGLLWLFLRNTATTITNIDKMAQNRQAMVDLGDIAPELKALPGRMDKLEHAIGRLDDRIGKLRP